MAVNQQHGPDDPDPTEIMPATVAVTSAGADEALPEGARLGRYRIESLLGRGGMGEVYRAEQLEPVRRTVALKLLRQQRVDTRHLAYFEVERQLLAQMRHPCIAQIYDAGATAEGYPFFAMEFIDGTPITRYCEDRSLPLRQRLELFIRVCQGVQHAHHKGVIHRDLKPGNILVDEVDGQPVPKIIDFGIATAASRALGGAAMERAGTPEYMSPEQGGTDPSAVDTRSDVYSLGVLLYELLAGRRPDSAHETIAADPATALRRPSEQWQALTPEQARHLAQAQGLSSARMQRTLRSELDWVVLKAMRYDRNQRYASAAELAEDLQCYLQGLPVQAVPQSRRYVLGKFVGRHRAGLLAAAVVVLALLGGLAMSLYGLMQAREQRAVAERRSVELEKVAAFQQSMLEGVDIEAMGLGMSSGLREQLAQADPADLDALERILGHASTSDLARGLIDRNILSSAERAISADFNDEPALAADLRESVGRVRHALGLYPEAAEDFRKVAEYRAGALGRGAVATLSARREQADALFNAVRIEQAARVTDAALADATVLPVTSRVRMQLELGHNDLVAAKGDRPAAVLGKQALYQRSLQAYGQADVLSLKIRESLATTLAQSGDLKAARAHMEALLPLSKKTLGENDKATLISTGTLAVMRAMTGDAEGAAELQQDLVKTQIARLGNEHPVTLTARANLVNMLIDSGRAQDAMAEAKAVLDARVRVLGADHQQTIRSMLNLATLYARLHEFDNALALQQRVIDARLRLLGPRHPDTLGIMINRVSTLQQSGRAQEALRELHDLLPLSRQVLEPGHPRLQEALMGLANASAQVGDRSGEINAYREVLAIRLQQNGADDVQTLQVTWKLVGALQQAGQGQEATQLSARYLDAVLAAKPETLKPNVARWVEQIRSESR